MVDGPSGVNGPSVMNRVVEEDSTGTGRVLQSHAPARHSLKGPAMNTPVEVN